MLVAAIRTISLWILYHNLFIKLHRCLPPQCYHHLSCLYFSYLLVLRTMLLHKRAFILMETRIRTVPHATNWLNLVTAVAHSTYASVMDTASPQALVVGAIG